MIKWASHFDINEVTHYVVADIFIAFLPTPVVQSWFHLNGAIV